MEEVLLKVKEKEREEEGKGDRRSFK